MSEERRISCPKVFNQEEGRGVVEKLKSEGLGSGEGVVLDFSQTESIDTSGAAWIIAIADHVRGKSGKLTWEGEKGQVAEFIQLMGPGLTTEAVKEKPEPGFLERIGDATLTAFDEFKDFANLCIDAIYWMVIAPFEGRGFRWALFIDELHEMGVKAVKINCLLNFLLGLTVAMMSAAQVDSLGLGIFVAYMIMIGFARELAALMTAIVVSARTGAAITAELATMEVQEEIDAMRGMGLNVSQFLIAPKLAALIVVMPCLTALGIISGILGGAVWGVFVLDFRPDRWFNETLWAARMTDVNQGMLKSLVFGVMIALIGCHNGLRVKGGSRGVGLMTTRSVVMDILFIVIIDMIFAAIFDYLIGNDTYA
jgi:phospholipid/cholesterol/gamma-HCH transport system permease protein